MRIVTAVMDRAELRAIRSLHPQFHDLRVIQLHGEKVSVGRSIENSVLITDTAISRTHCIFTQTTAANWVIKDISSTGTTVNGLKIPKNEDVALNDNDIIKFDLTGDFTYIFHNKQSENRPQKGIKRKSNESYDTENNSEQTMCQDYSDAFNMIDKRNLSSKYRNEIIENNMFDVSSTYESKEGLERNIASQSLLFESHPVKNKKCIKDGNTLYKNLELKLHKTETNIHYSHEDFENRLVELNELQSEKIEILRKGHEAKMRIIEMEKVELEEKLKETEAKISDKDMEINNLQNLIGVKQIEKQKYIDSLIYRISECEKIIDSEKKNQELLKQENTISKAIILKKHDELLQYASRCKQLEISKKKLLTSYAAIKNTIQTIRSLLQDVKDSTLALLALKDARDNLIENSNLPLNIMNNIDKKKQSMEDELLCPICTELLIKPVILSCGHTFCEHCIVTWMKKKKSCPSCRTGIKSRTHNVILESIIDNFVSQLDDCAKRRRLTTIKKREDLAKIRQASRKKSRRQRIPELPPRVLSSFVLEISVSSDEGEVNNI